MDHPTPSIDEIFFAAMERESPEARAAYLDQVCGPDLDLRRRVERLLDAQPKMGSFLDSPAAGPTMNVVSIEMLEGPGTVIGPYKLLEQIGEGGMGIVYMAEQTQPVRRKVALKIIKPGMDTRQVIARFEAERQALAIMDHPNIAKVLDAGATESGRPYFVMELVRGVPITEHCDKHRLPINKRLNLFVLVCQAVQHAHQKGIIHRDIKPTNILVTALDGVPLPRVIDFGIAKATGQSLTDKTLFTGFAQLIGTPLYMSPEQAELSAVDIDTRSDIYSLGVLLYELLTGTTPFDQDTFRTAALDEVRRIIREDEPPKPSTRLSALGATLTTVSENRQTDARKLNRSLRGELDWIVMKALEKDRRRRYETASGLARDVERYMAGDPVEAGPPSGWYRLRKFAQRNHVVLTASILVALALIAGTVVSLWQARLAHRARSEAIVQRDEAWRQQRRAETHLRQARDAVDQMLTKVGQDTLSRVPKMEAVRRRLLEKALGFYEKFLVEEGDDPTIRLEAGRAYRRVGDIQKLLGANDRAGDAYGRSILLLTLLLEGRNTDLAISRELAESRIKNGDLAQVTGKADQAEREYRSGIELRREIAERSAGLAEDRLYLARAQVWFAEFLYERVRLEAAREVFRLAGDLLERLVTEFPAEPRYKGFLAACLCGAGGAELSQRNFLKARGLFEQAAVYEDAAVESDPRNMNDRARVLEIQTHLSIAVVQLGNAKDAEPIMRKCIALGEALVADFPLVPLFREMAADCYNNLATMLLSRGAAGRDESLRAFKGAETMLVSLTTDYPDVPSYRAKLGKLLINRGHLYRGAERWKDAVKSYADAVTIGESLLAVDRADSAAKQLLSEFKQNLAILLEAWERQAGRGVIEIDYAARLLIAMARYRLGEKDAARALFDKASAEIASLKERDPKTLELLAEAAALLGVSRSAGSDSKRGNRPQ